jgi:hypothetical protein
MGQFDGALCFAANGHMTQASNAGCASPVLNRSFTIARQDDRMNGFSRLLPPSAASAVVILAFAASACAPRPPDVTREVLGLDVSGRPVVSFTTCEYHGLAGSQGGCARETPPVVWCYQSLGRNDCYRSPDRLATREPEPIVDVPTIPTLYAVPTPPGPPPTSPPTDRPDATQYSPLTPDQVP